MRRLLSLEMIKLRREDAAVIGLCTAFFNLWGMGATATVSGICVLFFAILGWFVLLAGRVCRRLLPLPAESCTDAPTIFLLGFFFLSTTLFALELISPTNLAQNALIVGGIVLLASVLSALTLPQIPAARSRGPAGLICILISLLAATFWAQDSIAPLLVNRDAVCWKPWADSFFHACLIRGFRDALGVGSMEEPSISGSPIHLYHYACYMVPALLARVTQTPCVLAFSGFLVPLGTFLYGLGAFTLGSALWGPRAGLPAAIALLLLPDASQYGVKNPWLGYHWLQQIGPAGAFGVALMAVAWTLLIEGCRRARIGLVAVGFLFTGCTAVYKAHVFVANALLIWLFPAGFLRSVRPRWRIAWLAVALSIFLFAVHLAGRSPAVPILRLDGSGMKSYLEKCVFYMNGTLIKSLFTIRADSSWPHDLIVGTIHLLLGTFGALPLACAVLAAVARRSLASPPDASQAEPPVDPLSAAVLLFPFLIMLNYLVMSLGLAPDVGSGRNPEELLHRTLVWAYFAVTVWFGGAFHVLILQPRLSRSPLLQKSLPWAVGAMLSVPLVLGADVQIGPEWGRDVTRLVFPMGLYRSALFLRDASEQGEICQDSEGDAYLAVSAFAERQPFAVDYHLGSKPPAIIARNESLRRIHMRSDPGEIRRFMKERKIAWYLLHPETAVAWPASIVGDPAFHYGGYRVIHFSDARSQ